MTFHILAIVADIATTILTMHDVLTFRQSVTDALHYLQDCAFQHRSSTPGFNAHMKAIAALANLSTVLACLPDLTPADTAMIFILLAFTSNECTH